MSHGPGNDADRIVGVTPSDQVEWAWWHPGGLQRRDEEQWITRLPDHKHGESLRSHGFVAREVREIRPDGQHDSVDPRHGHQLTESPDPTGAIEATKGIRGHLGFHQNEMTLTKDGSAPT
jgi:hypothetical protein